MKNNKYIKYIPTYCAMSIYDIDFDKLYEQGKKIILTDLDNTLISYRQNQADERLIELGEYLKNTGFKIFIVTNNNEKRVVEFSKTFVIDGYLTKANKPSPKKIEMFIKENKLQKEEIIYMGDQLVTDIAGANNAGLESAFISTIDPSSQKWYTKINRLREKRIIRKICKTDPTSAKRIENTINRGNVNE